MTSLPSASHPIPLNPSSPSNVARRLVVIATYNERNNIKELISRIISLKPSFQVLVVDDNSPDGTGEAVAALALEDRRVHLLRRPGKKGYGSAVIDGFRKALQLKADRIFTMDADHSHDPLDLPRLDEKLGNFSVAIGSRYLGGIRILNWSLGRLLLSLGANQYVRTLLRLKYTDCTSGFRAYRRDVIRKLLRHNTNSQGYAFLVEILNQIQLGGYRVGEVPIIYTERRAGQSKMSRMTIWEATWRPWLILLGRIWGKTDRKI